MRGPTTDTRKATIPMGSFIFSEGASKTYPWMKQVASMFSADSGDMANSQNTILTNGETYFPPDAVDAIGVDTLRYMNNKPKEGGHSAIDQLMVMNTLKNLQPMYGGGEITPANYANGGMVGYENGDVVRKTLYGAGRDFDRGELDIDDDSYNFRRVLSIPAEQVGGEGLRYYAGEGRSDRMQSARDIASFDAMQKMAVAPQDSIPFDMIEQYLKPQKRGLRELLGFQEGGPVESQTLKDIVEPYLPTKEDMLPYLEFLTGASAETESYKPDAVDLALSLPLIGGVGKGAAKGIKKLLRTYGKEGRKLDKIYGKGTAKKFFSQPETKYFQEAGGTRRTLTDKEMEAVRKYSGTTEDMWGLEGKYPVGMGEKRIGAIFGERAGERFRVSPTGKTLPAGDFIGETFQQGGPVGYQAGGPVQGAQPQAQPQPQPQNNLQINERQANPQMYQGSTLGSVREQVMMLQDSIMQADSVKIQATEDKAR